MTGNKQPRGLMTLFFTEMWERFNYYGMRALLVLYLTSEVIAGGLGMDRGGALEIYAIFTGLVYLTPVFGGLIADKWLGQRKSVLIGAIVMTIGQLVLALSESGASLAQRHHMLYYGLGIIIVGTGFFKPNISTIVGQLYSENDTRRDSGFTIFYMGINVGAFIAPLIAGTLGERIGWSWGFGSASIGMLIGLVWFVTQGPKLGKAGLPPKRIADEQAGHRLLLRDWIDIVAISTGSILLVIGCLMGWGALAEHTKSVLSTVLFVVGGSAIVYAIVTNTKGSTQWSRVAVIIILCMFNVFFWSGFEQVGGTLNLFAKEKVDLMVGSWQIPVSWFQSIGAVAIVVFAPLFSMMWEGLEKIKRNPNTPVKFALGLILLGSGFVVVSIADARAQTGILVSPLWLVVVYLLHTFGELSLSPIGLSMITKLSPPKITSVMMGLWFGSTALANYMAGMLEHILQNYLPDMPLFHFLVITSVSAGVVLLLISPFLKKMMKGIQ